MKKNISLLLAALLALAVCFAPAAQARTEEPGEAEYWGTWQLEAVGMNARLYSLSALQVNYRLELALAPWGQCLLTENTDPAVLYQWEMKDNGTAAAGGLALRINDQGLLEAADTDSGILLVFARTGDAPALATPEPAVVTTPAPVVVKTPEPVVVTTPAPVVVKTPEPAVVRTPVPVVVKTPEPAVVRTPAPVAVKTPEPVVVRTPALVAVKTPEPIVVRTPAPVAVKTPEPIVVSTLEPVVVRTPMPAVTRTPSPTLAPTVAPTARPTPMPTAAPAQPTAAPAPAQYVDVQFVCTAVSASGFAMDIKDLGGEYAVLLRKNGTADFKMAGYLMRDLKWKMDGKDYVLDYYGQELRFVPEEGKLLLKYMGTMDMTFTVKQE